jgi:hypothetical protein
MVSSVPGSRVDWLLALIASPLILAAALAPVLSVPLSYALGIGAIPASGGLGYALFRSGAATN